MANTPSHVSPQALDAGWMTIALEKFSFAVSPMGTESHQWVHDTRRDELFLVFRSVRLLQAEDKYENLFIMSVSVGSETLERQDMGTLAAIIEEYNDRVSKGLADHALEVPVHVVVKAPCVALRYPISSTTIRRIQMRFKNNVDYQRAIDIFQQLKFPIRNAGNKNPPVLPPQLGLLRPLSTSQIPQYILDHQTSIPTLMKPHGTPKSCIFNGSASYTIPRPFSATESSFFRRPKTASSEITRPNSSWSLDGMRLSETASSVSYDQPPRKPNSVLEPVGPESSLFVTQCQRDNRKSTMKSLSDASSLVGENSLRPVVSQFQDINVGFSRSRAEVFGLPLLDLQASSANQNLSEFYNELGQVRRPTSAYGNSIVQKYDISGHTDKRISLIPEFLRPLSAPIPANSESLSQGLPPRRELPFPKVRTTTRFKTPPIDQPPSPQPNVELGTEAAHNGQKVHIIPAINRNTRRVAQRQMNAPPAAIQDEVFGSATAENQGFEVRSTKQHELSDHEEEPSPLRARSAAVTRPSTAPGLRSKVTNKISRKRLSETEPEILPPSKQARRMVDKSTQTQTLSGRDHTAPHNLATGNERSYSTVVTDPTQTPPEPLMHAIEVFVSKHKNRPPPQEVWQRAGYSESSPEERQVMINDFICENLDNEEFLKLCEDTGDVWRRIGLEKI